MKKLFVLITLIAFAATTAFAVVDSTKKVKELTQKEYTVIANGDSITVTPGDTTNRVTFAEADSAKATGKIDFQMIKGQKTKVKEIMANGHKFWVKDDQDLTQPIEMWCDEDESQDPISAGFILLMTIISFAGVYAIWKFVFRG